MRAFGASAQRAGSAPEWSCSTWFATMCSMRAGSTTSRTRSTSSSANAGLHVSMSVGCSSMMR